MIEELQILKSIVGDLTGLGIWFVVMFFIYKLSIVGVFSGAVIAVYKICIKVFCCEVTKEKFDAMVLNHKQEIERKDEYYINIKKELAQAHAETERVLHMYELLKEANK